MAELSSKWTFRRTYGDAPETKGTRVLVDRMWPRGIKKETLDIDEWAKDAASSAELRSWFHDDREARWSEFKSRYRAELDDNAEAEDLAERLSHSAHVTLLTAAKDVEHSHVPVLAQWLQDNAGQSGTEPHTEER